MLPSVPFPPLYWSSPTSIIKLTITTFRPRDSRISTSSFDLIFGSYTAAAASSSPLSTIIRFHPITRSRYDLVVPFLHLLIVLFLPYAFITPWTPHSALFSCPQQSNVSNPSPSHQNVIRRIPSTRLAANPPPVHNSRYHGSTLNGRIASLPSHCRSSSNHVIRFRSQEPPNPWNLFRMVITLLL